MLFMAIYTTVDGIYLSKCVSTDAMAAVNISYPIVNVMFALGFGLAAGGSTRIASAIGEGNIKEADKRFTLLTVMGLLLSIISMFLLLVLLNPLLELLGATDQLLGYCKIYARIAVLSYPVGVMKEILGAVMRTQNLDMISMISSVSGGVTNIILDYLFIKVFDMGIQGAAIATCIGMFVALMINIFSLVYKGTIHLCRLRKSDLKEIIYIEKLSRSGVVMEISYAVTTWIFNRYSLLYGGEDGVAAYTVIGYIQYALAAIFIGIGMGLSPYISFAYGKGKESLQKVIPLVWKFSIFSGVIVTLAGYFYAGQLTGIFADRQTDVFSIAQKGVAVIAFSYLPMSINTSCSTILNSCEEGKNAAMITLLRTVIFLVVLACIMTRFIKLNGIWMAYVLAEICTVAISGIYYKNYRIKKESV